MSLNDFCSYNYNWEQVTGLDLGHALQKYAENTDGSELKETNITDSDIVNLCQPSNCQHDSGCSINLISRYPGISFKSVTVISDSRHIELFSNLSGYIGTVWCKCLQQSDDQKFYCGNLDLDESTEDLTLKFVSLTDEKRLRIYRIFIQTTSSRISPEHTGSFDLEKVRQIMTGMGESVPENATALLAAMEMMKQKKSKTVQGAAQIPGGMDSLLSMMGALNTGGGASSQQQDIHGMMQNICSAVTQTRAQPCSSADLPSQKDSKEIETKLNDLESRIMEKVDTRITQIEDKMMSKMDQILSVVTTVVKSRSPSSDEGDKGIPQD